jgi:hypothetical protein
MKLDPPLLSIRPVYCVQNLKQLGVAVKKFLSSHPSLFQDEIQGQEKILEG